MAAPPYRRVWLLLVFAWVTNYVIRMALPALLPPIIHELGLSYAQGGLLATAMFFYAYALMQFPAGVLGDRFGRRRVLVAGLVAGAVACALTGVAGSFAALLLVRTATGMSQGCLFANDRAIIAAVTPRDKISLGQAISFTGPGLGITAGLLLGGVLGDLMPWRDVFLVIAVPPVIAALAIARLVPETAPLRVTTGLGTRLRTVLAQPDLWVLGVAGGAVMWAQYLLATWAPLLFMEIGVRDLGRAAFLSSAQGLAAVAGLLVGGAAGDAARRRGVGHKVVLAVALAAMTVGLVVLGDVVHRRASALALVSVIVTVSFLAWSVWGPSFALLGEVFAGRDVSTAFGLYNTLCVLGAAAGPVAAGWARDATGSFVAGCYLSAGVTLLGVVVALAIRPAFRLAPPVPRGAAP